MRPDPSTPLVHSVSLGAISCNESAPTEDNSLECTAVRIFGDHSEIPESARADAEGFLKNILANDRLSDDYARTVNLTLSDRAGQDIYENATRDGVNDALSYAVSNSQTFSKFLNFKFGPNLSSVENLSFVMHDGLESSDEDSNNCIVVFIPKMPDLASEVPHWRAEVIYQFTHAVINGGSTDRPSEFNANAKVLAASVVNELANTSKDWDIPNFMSNWVIDLQQHVSLPHSRFSALSGLNQQTQHPGLAGSHKIDPSQKNKAARKRNQNEFDEHNPKSKSVLTKFLEKHEKRIPWFKPKKEVRSEEDAGTSLTAKL